MAEIAGTPVVTLGFTREELDEMEARAWPDSIESWLHDLVDKAIADNPNPVYEVETLRVALIEAKERLGQWGWGSDLALLGQINTALGIVPQPDDEHALMGDGEPKRSV